MKSNCFFEEQIFSAIKLPFTLKNCAMSRLGLLFGSYSEPNKGFNRLIDSNP